MRSKRFKEIYRIAMPLSDDERAQLGTEHPTSSFDYIPADKWEDLRDKLVNKKPSGSYVETDEFKYDPELTAYTPGEALDLLSHPRVMDWVNKIEGYVIPEEYKHIVLVPCAASKPWGTSCPGSGKYYKAYQDIKKQLNEEGKKAFWLTISEPLGIVPEDLWDSFPGYDVPGLFKDPSSQMSGMTTKDWNNLFGEKYSPPFDKQAWGLAIRRLGRVIANFINNNDIPGRRWISFVKGTKGKTTTHTEMIREAQGFLEEMGVDWAHSEHTKAREEKGHPTRTKIHDHISDILSEELD